MVRDWHLRKLWPSLYHQILHLSVPAVIFNVWDIEEIHAEKKRWKLKGCPSGQRQNCHMDSCCIFRTTWERKLQHLLITYLVLNNVPSIVPDTCLIFFFVSPFDCCVHVCSVFQLCLTLCDLMDCGLPCSSVHGILQAKILERVAISSFRGSSQPMDWTHISLNVTWHYSDYSLHAF